MMYGPVRYVRTGAPKYLLMAAGGSALANLAWVSMTMKVARCKAGSYQDVFASHKYGFIDWSVSALTATRPSLLTVTLLACQ